MPELLVISCKFKKRTTITPIFENYGIIIQDTQIKEGYVITQAEMICMKIWILLLLNENSKFYKDLNDLHLEPSGYKSHPMHL